VREGDYGSRIAAKMIPREYLVTRGGACKKKTGVVELVRDEFRFGKRMGLWGISPSPQSSGIIELRENLKVIYGAQLLTGKILTYNDLARIGVT